MTTVDLLKTWGGWAVAGAKGVFDLTKALAERAEKKRKTLETEIDARITVTVNPELLHATLAQINGKLDGVKDDVSGIRQDVTGLQADVARLEGVNEGRGGNGAGFVPRESRMPIAAQKG